MYNFLAQVIFAARNDDFGGWMQILVFVAVMVVYALSGILKAKTKKTEPEEGKEKPQRPHPAGPVPEPQYRQEVQPQPREIARPQPAVQKLAAKAEKTSRIPAVEPPAKPKLSIPIPQVQIDIPEIPKREVKMQELPEFTSETIRKLEGKRVSPAVPAETPRAKYLTEILLDYADPEELRRAILHYEILGKPLSLRGPGEQIVWL